ncbi:MAG: SRPBCC domain-containing protein [Phenylobacterium sp.]|uniref:SRPBCC domain-containing protein n=1 Tax=Phenylobacterium sp. TaxID=1871053 RepID=UPI0025E8FEC1|nr:SRPBCC domain-containing protein [Phenylobacterium sp.]MBA4011632.1 SRPBCC domain-containing protein [Phenylobacterium sp.]
MHQIRTEAIIPATPDQVWAVLADFARYSEWNPLNLEVRGEAKLGTRARMAFRNLAGQGVIRQTVRIVAAEPGRELAWSGHVPLLFAGRHGFLLTPHAAGTHVLHTELLGGLLPATWSKAKIARDFVPAYEAVNVALAQRFADLAV